MYATYKNRGVCSSLAAVFCVGVRNAGNKQTQNAIHNKHYCTFGVALNMLLDVSISSDSDGHGGVLWLRIVLVGVRVGSTLALTVQQSNVDRNTKFSLSTRAKKLTFKHYITCGCQPPWGALGRSGALRSPNPEPGVPPTGARTGA